jgi:hypothetical protein
MEDPARKAERRAIQRLLRSKARRLYRRSITVKLKLLSVKARLFILKTPDYLSTFLVAIFRRAHN